MPKRVVTRASVPKILRELDRWEGKLTWPAFCARVAKILDVESVSRHTLYLYPTIKERFQQRQKDLRAAVHELPRDYTLVAAKRRILSLEAEVKRLEEMNTLLLDQFRRWQYNAFANNVRMDMLAWDKPLPEVNRAGRARSTQRKQRSSSNE